MATIIDTPKVMTDGNSRLGLFIDDQATEEQSEKLVHALVRFGATTGEPVRFAGMFHPVASDVTMAEAKRSKINAFGIRYEGKTGLSTSEFSWAA